MPPRRTLAERFQAKVGPPDARGCRPWLGAKDRSGYGKLADGGKTLQAHRVAWGLANGHPAPDGLCVLHSCDRPDCVAAEHLSLGDHPENMRQVFQRGRQTPAQERWAIRSLDRKQGR